MRVKMLQNKDELGLRKGSVWNVAKELGEQLVEAGDAALELDSPTGKATLSCTATKNDTSVDVSASVSPSGTVPEGSYAQLRLVSIEGGAQLVSGPAIGEWQRASGSWRFARGTSPGTAKIVSQCTGHTPEVFTALIPAIEQKSDESAEKQPRVSGRSRTSQES